MNPHSRPLAKRLASQAALAASLAFIVASWFDEPGALAAAGTESAPSRDAGPRPGQLALTVGLPIENYEKVHGELSVDARYGYKFAWLVPYLSFGFRQNRLDPNDWPWEARFKKLRAWHVTAGTRLEFPASRKLLPFVGMGVERNSYSYTEDATSYCHEPYYPDVWRCYPNTDSKAGYGIKPQIGFIYLPEPSLALEFWLEYIHVVNEGMFTRNAGFIHPALGLSWHH